MTSSAALRGPAARSAGPARLPAARLPATWLLVAAVAVGNTLLLFRHSLLSGFAQISGDPWDGRIALSLFEHWHRVLTLQSSWRSPLFFHPAADALGYSDAFFLHGMIYSLGRAAGLDQYVSYELVAVAFKLIGFFGFYGFARRLLRVRTGWALVGASVFFQLNAAALQLNHQQLLVLAVFPSLIELAVAFALALAAGRRLRALGLGLAAAALGAACLMSGLYMSWYLALFAAAVAVLYALLAPRQAIAGLRRAAAAAIAGGWMVPVLLACAALLLLPALATYLPTARETGMHSVAAIRDYAGTPIDIVNLGTGNWLWSDLLDAASVRLTGARLAEGERTSGMTPTLLVLGLIAAAWLWRRPPPARGVARAVLLAAALLWLASVRIGDFLGWEYVFTYVPFGRATRVPPRLQLFLQLPLLLVVTLWLDRVRWFDPPLRFAGLALLLVLEQFNTWYGWGMQPAIENRLLAQVPPPPAECRSFFVTRAMARPGLSQQLRDDYAAAVDGMIVAAWSGLPTLNGMQSFVPRDWDLNRPEAPDYRDRVLRYARRNGIADGLCALDIEAGRWEPAGG